ncbi:hypothetical protein [Phyllobacterium myrsinacearum]|nr:hypothetical protein [Phyllobacterium myrsinacearum]
MLNRMGNNGRKISAAFLVAGAACLALFINACIVEARDYSMKSDVTIYLDRPLLDRGGTVFVVPNEIPADEWKPHLDQPNPARSDPRLDIRVPITARDRRLSARASGQVSVVRFDYPKGGSYDFRFLPSLESGVPPEKQGSILVTAGNTYDYHPKTREEKFIPEFQVFTIIGPDADEEKSRALVSEVKLGYLEERYNCAPFEGVVSCSVRELSK